jgi:hypothetical protein
VQDANDKDGENEKIKYYHLEEREDKEKKIEIENEIEIERAKLKRVTRQRINSRHYLSILRVVHYQYGRSVGKSLFISSNLPSLSFLPSHSQPIPLSLTL